jgi:hypothetical protein
MYRLRSLPRSFYVQFMMNLSDQASLATNRNQIEFEMLHPFLDDLLLQNNRIEAFGGERVILSVKH